MKALRAHTVLAILLVYQAANIAIWNSHLNSEKERRLGGFTRHNPSIKVNLIAAH